VRTTRRGGSSNATSCPACTKPTERTNDANRVAELLNDVEMLPDYLADERDRTGEFVEMLQGIAQVHPGCRYIVEEFEQNSGSSASLVNRNQEIVMSAWAAAFLSVGVQHARPQ
jgi:hypothetical protein